MKLKIRLNKNIWIFLLIFIILIGLYFQYVYTKQNLIQSYKNRVISATFQIRDKFKSILNNAEIEFKVSLKSNLEALHYIQHLYKGIRTFNPKNIAKILNEEYEGSGRYEVFVIDRNYTIIKGSYEPDIGYNLGTFPAFKKVLDDVFEGKKDVDISSVHLDIASLNLKRYFLIRSPDKKYLLQIAYVIDIYPKMQETYYKLKAYYKDLKDLPVAATDTSKVYESTGLGYAKGIELTLTKKMSDDLYLLLNYTYSHSRRQDSAILEEYDFDYDSPHILNVMATYKLGDWWEFGLIYRYASGLPYTPYDLSTLRQVNGTWYCDKAAKNSARLPDYQRLDIRIDHRFVFSTWNFSLYLEVWNLTNHDNITRYEYSADFSEKDPVILFTMMPMIGLATEF